MLCNFFGAAPLPRPPPARTSTAFLKPSSDDEDSGPSNASIPAWKKSSNPARECDSLEKQGDPGKTVTASQDGLRADKAAVTTSRFQAFYFCGLVKHHSADRRFQLYVRLGGHMNTYHIPPLKSFATDF